MSVARGFGLNGKSIYANVAKPMLVEMQFTVTATNGLGVTSVKSNGYVENVFMHTSTTPAVGNNGLTNPNPAAGYIMIQLKQNFNYFLGLTHVFQVPAATSTKVDNTALTVGNAYAITTLGNTTAAQWATLGVPAGVVPAVGVAFIALLTGVAGQANTSTSRVMIPSTSGVDLVEVIGNTSIATTTSISSQSGQWLLLQCSKASTVMTSYTPAGTVAAPTFTGDALATHSHILNLKNAAVSDGATTRVNAGTNLLGANTGGDLAIAGGGANGGIAAITAGTPSGTNSAPAFTGTPATLTATTTQILVAPAAGSICQLALWFDGSSVTIDGL